MRAGEHGRTVSVRQRAGLVELAPRYDGHRPVGGRRLRGRCNTPLRGPSQELPAGGGQRSEWDAYVLVNPNRVTMDSRSHFAANSASGWAVTTSR
ncbi:hypothetical protein C9J85_14790 [Haloferax sp. wsp5]|nr:hypothetical protein C9J85_14790 [Haloferax sp. wsp5]